ncbi:hypothetical protein ABIF68_010602 [Bradyrhizobium japonicum]
MVSTSFMVDTSSHPRAQLHRCVERSAYGAPIPADQIPKINGPLTGLHGWHDRPGTIERLRRAWFIRLAHAGMMDQANIPAASWSKRSRK